MKKYIIPLFTIIIVAFLLLGFKYLWSLIFNNLNSHEFIWSLMMALGLYAMETGAKPTEYGRKSDLKVLVFLIMFVIVATIIMGSIWEKVEFIKLLKMCISFPFMAIAAYFGMAAYTNWSNKRSARKKNKEISQ
ncbi:MAG: hypothetical protein LBC68_10630 [Prevotellaceae bacterium]|nr:hypothetical protein [Prevotellaceae bacterium]